ncbi:MAG TPA: zinc ribbon domain-containing protein [Nitrosopumilaceae archaeon]|nr:zinc ribbon domain-containing protein [Nitrosopumilaceae archaeon]
MKFESELKKGVFVVGKCPKCKKATWPPSDYCNLCFGNLEWRESSYEGKLIEFAKKNDEIFCIAEIDEGIRVMGTLILNSTKPEIGSKIRLKKCGIKNGNYSFVMSLC